jgi:hypothetical protein
VRSSAKKAAGYLVRALVMCAGLSACGHPGFARTLTPPLESRSVSDRAADVQAIATWNIIALKTTAAGPYSPPRETRSLAIVFAAVNDAVCSITRQCDVYTKRIAVRHDASIQAAVDAAAHDALVALYPASASVTSLDASYDSAVATLPAGQARDAGAAAGEAAAAAMLALRANDHSQDPMSYTPAPGAGLWGPTLPALAPALEPAWGQVTPFGLHAGSQFRPPPPPAPGSDPAVRDYLEVQSIGALHSATRTAFQTETALFWVATAPQNWNQVVRELTTTRGMNAAKAARAYMILNMAGADAVIAAWDAKFAYSQWRPLTAIRSALDDGSSATVPDPDWTPLVTTPRFPDYICGHSAYAGAAERVLTGLFGEQPGTLSITSATAGGATHTYQSFRAIGDEVTDARVWAGIHWRTSCVVGRAVGQQVGDAALARFGDVDSDDKARDRTGRLGRRPILGGVGP